MSNENEYLRDVLDLVHAAWRKMDEASKRAKDAGDTELAWEITLRRFELTDLSGDVFRRIYPREKIAAGLERKG